MPLNKLIHRYVSPLLTPRSPPPKPALTIVKRASLWVVKPSRTCGDYLIKEANYVGPTTGSMFGRVGELIGPLGNYYRRIECYGDCLRNGDGEIV